MDEGILKVLSFVIGNLPESANVKKKMILSDKNAFQPEHKDVVFIVRPEISVMRKVIF